MLKKFNQSFFAATLLASTLMAEKVQALQWDYIWSGPYFNSAGTLTTDGTDSTGSNYLVTGITGTWNGQQIDSLLPVNSYPGFGFRFNDNRINPNSGNGFLLTQPNESISYGIGISVGGTQYLLMLQDYMGMGDPRFWAYAVDTIPQSYSSTSFSITPAASAEVPFDFDPAFGVALGLPLFISLRYLKKIAASKKLKYNPNGTVI